MIGRLKGKGTKGCLFIFMHPAYHSGLLFLWIDLGVHGLMIYYEFNPMESTISFKMIK
jgi:hypothetical protein